MISSTVVSKMLSASAACVKFWLWIVVIQELNPKFTASKEPLEMRIPRKQSRDNKATVRRV